MDAARLAALLSPRFPRTTERASVGLVEWKGELTGLDPAIGLWACLRLAKSPAATGGSTSVCIFVQPKHLGISDARLEAYVVGWVVALDHVLANAAANVLEHAIPANLVCPQVLDLARPKTPEEFTTAILAPRRLGKLVGDPVAAMRSLDHGRA